MLALLGCFFAHLSYSLRMARFASSFFMLDKWIFPRQHAVKRGSAAVNHSALHGMAVFFPKQINAGAIITLMKFVLGFLGTLSLKDLSAPFVTKWRR